ncbi:Tm-1-like ATP-binding domain-containing protein [Fibrella aquatica]|uniref:Tm-1-like ATP-binding domain-containing protein n=1 Tax=Fibrella aquatica TaxID=3242487 RepID=UPI0035203FF9
MNKSIVLIGCFDTKGAEFALLRTRILERGLPVITINTGVMDTRPTFPEDYTAEEVAQIAGISLTDLQKTPDRGYAIERMSNGATQLVRRLVSEDRVAGAVGMGGGGGTFIALSAMQEIPFGIPKLCISTLAAKDLSRQVGAKDIVLMPSVVDIAGLNSILCPLIEQAAAAICAMARLEQVPARHASGCIAISMFGNTTPCVERCSQLITEQGYEVFTFHANGIGGRTMESLILEGIFDAVLDITTTELADELCGGICSAGANRMQAAAQLNIPQVVVPGCLDMVNFGHPDTVPASFKQRHLYSWAPDVTLMRTNAAENNWLGTHLAQQINRSAGPVAVVLPLKGLSQLDTEGGIFFEPQVDKVLFDAIKATVSPRVTVVESDAHINDRAFAELLVTSLLALIESKKRT